MDIIQIVWLCIPGLYLIVGFYDWLEKTFNKVSNKKREPEQFLRQLIYISITVGACMLFDNIVVKPTIGPKLPKFFPLVLFRIFLLPAFFLLTARIFGSTHQYSIRDTKARQDARKNQYKKGK